jgi:eukaryotic-like serine/threonine-protein kinase
MSTADRNLPDVAWPAGPAGAADQAMLAPGVVLAGRFRLQSFLAQGGMGAVWEAEDLALHERVAVKTLRAEIAGDEWALSQFRREIQLGRRVTHRNVCRTFDLMQHDPASGGPSSPVAFLTMELLAGETLSERLRRTGRLTLAEALAVTVELAEGLHAAHAAGIVHGDLKSGNVLLTGPIAAATGRDADSRGPKASGLAAAAGRVVITDFGLARGLRSEPGETTRHSAGDLAGTPAYMAPEQLRGAPPSPAADIYALGVIVFEMVTGSLPFAGDTPFSAALRRLTEPPRPPRQLVPELPAAWERAILRALARRPAERFTDPRDLALALAGEKVASAPRRRLWRALGMASGAVGIALAAGTAWRLTTAPAPPPAGEVGRSAAPSRRAIAVLGFQNLSGREEAAWLSVALSEMLATELQAGTKLRVVPAETVARMKAELALGDHESLAPDTLRRVRRNLGADVVVLGSYISLAPTAGGLFRVDIRVQDAESAETLAALSRSGSVDKLFELVSGAGNELRSTLGIAAAAPVSVEVLAAFPADPEAARLYAEGLGQLRRFDAVSARTTLAKAAELAPTAASIHAALGTAWRELGYDEQARQEARRAFDLASGLPRLERLAIEGGFRESVGEWARAEEIYRELVASDPDSLEARLRLVQAQISGGKPNAIDTIGQLRRLPAPLGNDARIELVAAQAYQAVSNYPLQLAAARAAAQAGEAAGAVLLVARARLSEARVLRIQGDRPGAAAAAAAARTAFAAAGDLSGAARAQVSLGIVTWQGGDRQAALDLYREALASYQATGNQRGSAEVLNNIAIVLMEQGDVAGARQMYERVLAVDRETHNRAGYASTLNNLGTTFYSQGDLDSARRTHEEALAVRRELGDRQGEAISGNNLALVLVEQGATAAAAAMYDQVLIAFRELGDRSAEADALRGRAMLAAQAGDLGLARTALERAIALKGEIEDRAGEAGALTDLGRVGLLSGDVAAARQRFEAALAMRIAQEDGIGIAESRTNLAALVLAEGDQTGASRLAEEALRGLAAATGAVNASVGVATDARLLLARIATDQGQVATAQTLLPEIERAVAARSVAWSAKLAAGLLRARLRAQTGDPAAAVRDATALRDEAARRGRAADVLAARLALTEIEGDASGEREGIRARYAAIAADARRAGFGGIAAEAERMGGLR